jgi:DNA-binding response OmpR family regulator
MRETMISTDLISTASDGQQTDTKTILIVEDDESIGKFLVMLLSQETGCQAVHVTDAFQALRVVSTTVPALMITDYRLPRMTGIELYDLLHAQKAIEQMPVIMLSAQLPEQEVRQRKLIGMRKPFELDELLDTVERLLA